LLEIHYRGNVIVMGIAQSKITAQGQISVPAEVRKKLGVGPGSVLEWEEQGSEVVVRRAGRHSSKDIYLALFLGKTPKKDLPDVKDAIRKYIRKRHARS
jgi:antitoxin PrlF